MSAGFIPRHGGYRNLISYKRAEIVYDATVRFCGRFVDPRSRTTDQMIQAARSGKQNIAEGSMASGTSKETEIKLTNVARASLQELLEDYLDFLRTRGLETWEKENPKAVAIRKLSRGTDGADATYETYAKYVEQYSAETAANTIICLLHQTQYLLDQQIRRLEEKFVQEGGLRERMTKARLEYRSGKEPQ